MSKLQTQTLLAAANSVAAGAAVECSVLPFNVGATVVGEINCNGFTGTVMIQISDTSDFAATTDYTVTGTTTDQTKKFKFKLGQFVRGNVTVHSAGSVDAQLLS